MSSTNEGKEVKSNQTTGQKGKKYYIELYNSLDAQLNSDCDLRTRTAHLCSAWARIHSICRHALPASHPLLLAWLERHTARVVLQTEWQSPSSKDEHDTFTQALDAIVEEIAENVSQRDGTKFPWEDILEARAQWFKVVLSNPWDHPVLRVLLDPREPAPSDDDVIEWLKGERDIMFVTRLRQLVASKCDDLATSLASAVMDRARAARVVVPDDEQAEEQKDKPPPLEDRPPTFEERLRSEAGFTEDVWALLTDIELVLLLKVDKRARCIELAKQTPLRSGYELIQRLQKRLENAKTSRDRKLWKNATEVATLIAQVVITRCMVVPVCTGVPRGALYWSVRALAALKPAPELQRAARELTKYATTSHHLYWMAKAICVQKNTEEMKPFVCEQYVRAITFGMNELEKLKLDPQKEAQARLAEQTIANWFLELGSLFASDRFKCECMLTAFSVHPSPDMYKRIKESPDLPKIAVDPQEPKDEVKSEFGSWATDSRSQTNFVKTSEHLKMKQTQQQANVLSTAILTEGEALGLTVELCQDIAVLLSGPRVKTLSWDMDRTLLLENCRNYMERTDGGTRALTTELKYININPDDFMHLPEEEDDENDLYYGIEKGYEHLVEFQEPEPVTIWDDMWEETEDAYSSGTESDHTSLSRVSRRKKREVKSHSSDSEDCDPLSTIAAECKKKKERPHSKERNKERRKQNKERSNSEKKEKKERKKKEKVPKETDQTPSSLSSLVGIKVARGEDKATEIEHESLAKLSLQSGNNSQNIIYDGQFSMDELISPERRSSVDSVKIPLSSLNGAKVLKPDAVIQPDTSKKQTQKTQKPETSSKQDKTNENTKKQPFFDARNEDVKRRISSLLKFRRKNQAGNSSSSVQRPNQETVKIELSSLVGSKIVQPSETNKVFESPKICMTPKQTEQLSALSQEMNNLLTSNKLPAGIKIANPNKCFNMSKVGECSRTVPFKIDYAKRKTVPNILNHNEVQREPVNLIKNIDNKKNNVQEQQQENITKKLDVEAHIPSNKVVEPRPAFDVQQKNFQQFLKELQGSNNAGVESPKEKVSSHKVTPIIMNIPSFSTSSPSAKTVVQCKKVDNAPNTFARLSYMHKKHVESQIESLPKQANSIVNQLALQNSISAELDKRVAEFRKLKTFQNKRTMVSQVKQQQSPKVEVQTIEESHPVLSNILNSGPGDIFKTTALQNTDCTNIQQMKTPMENRSTLSEKDQQELVCLLRQKAYLNESQTLKKQETSVIKNAAALHAPCSAATFNDSVNMSLINKTVLSVPSVVQSNPTVISSADAIRTADMIQHNRTPIPQETKLKQTTQNVSKVKNVNILKRSTKKFKDSREEMTQVLDAIRAQKTPSRGPSALDMVMKNETYEKFIKESAHSRGSSALDTVMKNEAKSAPSCGPSALDKAMKNETYEKFIKESALSRGSSASDTSMKNEMYEKFINTTAPDKVDYNKPTEHVQILSSGIQQNRVVNAVSKVGEQLKQSSVQNIDTEKNCPSTSSVHQTNIAGKFLSTNKILGMANTPKQLPKTKISDPKNVNFSNKTCGSKTKKTASKQGLPNKKINMAPLIEVTRKPTEGTKAYPSDIFKRNDSKTFLFEVPKLDDPFISGLQNSDYDLLEELMDDELRQEIGELSDEERFGSIRQALSCEPKVQHPKPFDLQSAITKNEPKVIIDIRGILNKDKSGQTTPSIVEKNPVKSNKIQVVESKIIKPPDNINWKPESVSKNQSSQVSVQKPKVSSSLPKNAFVSPKDIIIPPANDDKTLHVVNQNKIHATVPLPTPVLTTTQVLQPDITKPVLLTSVTQSLIPNVVVVQNNAYSPYVAAQTVQNNLMQTNIYIPVDTTQTVPFQVTVPVQQTESLNIENAPSMVPVTTSFTSYSGLDRLAEAAQYVTTINEKTTVNNEKINVNEDIEKPGNDAKRITRENYKISDMKEQSEHANNYVTSESDTETVVNKDNRTEIRNTSKCVTTINDNQKSVNKKEDVEQLKEQVKDLPSLEKTLEKNLKTKILDAFDEKVQVYSVTVDSYHKQINKNERKVLSEVQEKLKQSPEKTVLKQPKCTATSVEQTLIKSNANDQERLKKKRLAILNRDVNQRCFYPPIPLMYASLKDIGSNRVITHTMVVNSKENQAVDDSFRLLKTKTSDDRITVQKTAVEQKSDTTNCTSSNTVVTEAKKKVVAKTETQAVRTSNRIRIRKSKMMNDAKVQSKSIEKQNVQLGTSVQQLSKSVESTSVHLVSQSENAPDNVDLDMVCESEEPVRKSSTYDKIIISRKTASKDKIIEPKQNVSPSDSEITCEKTIVGNKLASTILPPQSSIEKPAAAKDVKPKEVNNSSAFSKCGVIEGNIVTTELNLETTSKKQNKLIQELKPAASNLETKSIKSTKLIQELKPASSNLERAAKIPTKLIHELDSTISKSKSQRTVMECGSKDHNISLKPGTSLLKYNLTSTSFLEDPTLKEDVGNTNNIGKNVAKVTNKELNPRSVLNRQNDDLPNMECDEVITLDRPVKPKVQNTKQSIDQNIQISKNDRLPNLCCNDVITLDSPVKPKVHHTTVDESKNTPRGLPTVTQELKDNIIIEEIPRPQWKVPHKREIRIKLPNGKSFRANVQGAVPVSFDALFAQPAFKDILYGGKLKDSNCLVKINIKDYASPNQTINITKKMKPSKGSVETVNLISDDEEEEPKYCFSTEFGTFPVKSVTKHVGDKHQMKFSQKCSVKLPKLKEFTCKTESKETSCFMPGDLKKTTLIQDLVKAVLKDLPGLPIPKEKALVRSTPASNEVIVIDDDSNDSVIVDENSPSTQITELKSLLLAEMGVKHVISEPKPNDNINAERNKDYNIMTGVKTTEEKNAKDFSEILKQPCFVKLINCDHLVNKVENSSDESLISEIILPDSESEIIITNDIQENTLSRCESVSLLQNINTAENELIISTLDSDSNGPTSPVMQAFESIAASYRRPRGRTSPVMVIYDLIASVNKKALLDKVSEKEEPVRGLIVCGSDWMETKSCLRCRFGELDGTLLSIQANIARNLAETNRSQDEDTAYFKCESDWFVTKRMICQFSIPAIDKKYVSQTKEEELLINSKQDEKTICSVCFDIYECRSEWLKNKSTNYKRGSTDMELCEDIFLSTNNDRTSDLIKNNLTANSLMNIMTKYFQGNDIINYLKPSLSDRNCEVTLTNLKRKLPRSLSRRSTKTDETRKHAKKSKVPDNEFLRGGNSKAILKSNAEISKIPLEATEPVEPALKSLNDTSYAIRNKKGYGLTTELGQNEKSTLYIEQQHFPRVIEFSCDDHDRLSPTILSEDLILDIQTVSSENCDSVISNQCSVKDNRYSLEISTELSELNTDMWREPIQKTQAQNLDSDASTSDLESCDESDVTHVSDLEYIEDKINNINKCEATENEIKRCHEINVQTVDLESCDESDVTNVSDVTDVEDKCVSSVNDFQTEKLQFESAKEAEVTPVKEPNFVETLPSQPDEEIDESTVTGDEIVTVSSPEIESKGCQEVPVQTADMKSSYKSDVIKGSYLADIQDKVNDDEKCGTVYNESAYTEITENRQSESPEEREVTPVRYLDFQKKLSSQLDEVESSVTDNETIVVSNPEPKIKECQGIRVQIDDLKSCEESVVTSVLDLTDIKEKINDDSNYGAIDNETFTVIVKNEQPESTKEKDLNSLQMLPSQLGEDELSVTDSEIVTVSNPENEIKAFEDILVQTVDIESCDESDMTKNDSDKCGVKKTKINCTRFIENKQSENPQKQTPARDSSEILSSQLNEVESSSTDIEVVTVNIPENEDACQNIPGQIVDLKSCDDSNVINLSDLSDIEDKINDDKQCGSADKESYYAEVLENKQFERRKEDKVALVTDVGCLDMLPSQLDKVESSVTDSKALTVDNPDNEIKECQEISVQTVDNSNNNLEEKYNSPVTLVEFERNVQTESDLTISQVKAETLDETNSCDSGSQKIEDTLSSSVKERDVKDKGEINVSTCKLFENTINSNNIDETNEEKKDKHIDNLNETTRTKKTTDLTDDNIFAVSFYDYQMEVITERLETISPVSAQSEQYDENQCDVSVKSNDISEENDEAEISPPDILNQNVALVYKDESGVILKGVEYEDPERGTLYVFPLVKSFDTSSDSDVLNSNDENMDNHNPNNDLYHEDVLELLVPKRTYSKKSRKRKARACNFDDGDEKRAKRSPRATVKYKFKKPKRIDFRKITINSIKETSYAKEYSRLIDYYSTIKFSYSIPFDKEYIDVLELLHDWPLKNSIKNDQFEEDEVHSSLFTDLEEPCKIFDPMSESLAEEITKKYPTEFSEDEEDETNFNMGFGEWSDRVKQNMVNIGTISEFSAATLSDVKQSQPFLLSEDYESTDHTLCPQDDEIEKRKRYITYIRLKDKVRSFFRKSTVELTCEYYKLMTKPKKTEDMSFPFDLYSSNNFQPSEVESIVQVVQVGQLPVSAAAQNPVICDPRVTQVSDASPSQFTVENGPHDESQPTIKTEYTELTTADLSLPMRNYTEINQSMSSLESQEAANMTTDNLPINPDFIKSEVKIELMEESDDNQNEYPTTQEPTPYAVEQQTAMANHVNNNEFTFSTNNPVTTETESSAPLIFTSPVNDEAPNTEDTVREPEERKDRSTEKNDQIAHAMNAAGITTTVTPPPQKAHTLVNLLSSQKVRQNVVTTPNTTNSFQKTSTNTMSLQQALAQILPPPLNQTTNVDTNNHNIQSQPLAPQVLHIVQGKNASGNQITLLDNSQHSVINAPSATPVLHIVQNKPAVSGATSNGTPNPQQNTFSGLSLVDTGLQQGGNQLLHIVNTGNQKNNATGPLLKRVNLLTNIANVQGSNEQKMVQFVCKSADGKAIQLNAPAQRGMVLRLQPIETPHVQTLPQKPPDNQEQNQIPTSVNSTPLKETTSVQQQESTKKISSRSGYEENYAKFIQSSTQKPHNAEKSTSLPKFNQAFGKPVFQEENQKNEINSNNSHLPVGSNTENTECPPAENSINLEHLTQLSSPPLLLRKTTPPHSHAQPNLVQQIKQTIAPMNIQTMHGGVIYTRQIPVNIGGGQTINLITVPTADLIEDKQQNENKFTNHGEIEPSIIKIVPQTQPSHSEGSEGQNHSVTTNENPQPQPVLTQMRIKLPMLSKAPQMVAGARVVRPSFFQIQRNVVGGPNQPVYQQLVLTAAPPLGQQTIRLPQAQARPVKVPSESQSSTESMSSSTLEQLREFDMVLEQVKERSTVQPNSNSNFKIGSTDTTDSAASTSPTETTQQVLYSIGSNQSVNVAYVNRKVPVTTPLTTAFVRSPDSSGITDSPTSSTQIPVTHTVTSESSGSDTPAPKPHKSKKSRSKSSSHLPNSMKINSVAPKSSSQKPLEDEQTTQRILYILAEYKEQVENSPDKDKPAPRRRSNPPSSSSGSSKRKKSSSGSRRSGRDVSPSEDTSRTLGSEDSSCGTSQGDCTENCLEPTSPQDSPRKVVRKLTFEQEQQVLNQSRPQPQRNVIVADGQTITVARGAAGKPATAVLMPANYILPVSMVKGGQQIAIVTNRGPKLLTVGGGEGGATNAVLLQRLIGPAGLKPVLARPGVRHVRLPTAALHNIQTFNLATTATVQPPPDSTVSPAPVTTPPELVDTRAENSPWPEEQKPERASSPESSEPWNLPTSADPHDYSYEETVRTDNLDRTVLDPIPDRYSPDMEAQRIFDKMFDVESKKSYIVDSHDDSPRCGYDIDASDDDKGYQVVHKKDGSARQHRLAHVSAAALRHKYAILEHELRLQKSLSEECSDLGVDSPSASELFPEAELLFASSPAQDHHQEHVAHTAQTLLPQSAIQPDIDDQIATDQLLPRTMAENRQDLDVNLGLEDVGIVTVSEDGMQATIALDQEEFARSHPNTTFHSEPTDEGEVQPFTITTGIKSSRQITSTIFHSNRAPATVLMTAPQTSVISQATGEPSQNHVKYDLENMIHAMPSSHGNHVNLSSVLVNKDDGLTRYDNILNDSRELHLSNTASAIVHATGNATQVIRRVCYEDDKRERERYLMDEPEGLIAGEDAKMISDDATLGSMVDDVNSSPERHTELFWESNSASERSESRRPLDFSSDSDKCCKSPSYDETNSTDSSGVGTHMRLDSVIKDARGIERSASAGSSADDTHPPLRTYPAKRSYHNLEDNMERSLSGKTRAGERSPDSLEVRRRASGRGVVKRGCHCCNGSPAPPRPKKPRQRKPTTDFNAT